MAIGMFSSQRFGYAIHSLCYMAKKSQGQLTTFPELAEWLQTIWPNISDSYLSNVIQRLAHGGLLHSHRGISGGYSLAKDPDSITLRDLVELLEGVALDRCSLSLEGKCPIEGHCHLQDKLRLLEEEYLESLSRLSIAELSKDIVVKHPKNKKKARA